MKSLLSSLVLFSALAAQGAQRPPRTLLEMASGKIPFDPDSAALVLIDYQNEYVSGRLPLHQIQQVVSEARRVLDWARQKRIPIIHVLHRGKPGGIFGYHSGQRQGEPDAGPCYWRKSDL